MDFTFHKMHLFKVHNLMNFGIFIKLGNHHNNLILEHFQQIQEKPCTITSGVAPPPHPLLYTPASKNHYLLSVSIVVPI